MNAFYLEIVGSILRWLLSSLSAYAVAQHILTADQTDKLTSDLAYHLMLAAPAVGALIWSIVQKYRSRLQLLTALENPPMTEDKMKGLIKNGMGATLALLFAAFVSLSACSVSLKQHAVQSVQAAETSLGTAQDFELSTYHAATLPALTAQRHAAIQRTFSHAFQVQIDAATALKAYKAGDPVPASVSAVLADAQVVWGLAAQIVPSLQAKTPEETALLAKIKGWIADVATLVQLFNVPIPPALQSALS